MWCCYFSQLAAVLPYTVSFHTALADKPTLHLLVGISTDNFFKLNFNCTKSALSLVCTVYIVKIA